MANAVYSYAKQLFLTGGLNWTNAGTDIKIAAVKTGYVFSAAHTSYSDLGANVVAVCDNPLGFGAQGAKTATDGVAKGDTTTGTVFSGVPNVEVLYLVVFHDTGVPGTSTLIAYLDTGTGLPFQTNLGNVVLDWDAVNGIFSL